MPAPYIVVSVTCKTKLADDVIVEAKLEVNTNNPVITVIESLEKHLKDNDHTVTIQCWGLLDSTEWKRNESEYVTVLDLLEMAHHPSELVMSFS